MSSAFPQYKIEDYFYFTGAIKDKGLKIILDSYLPKLAPDTKYSIVNSYPALTAKIQTAMKKSKSYGIFFHEGQNAHWTLIYLNRNLKSEDCTIQILDSVGHAQVFPISEAIKKGMPSNCKIASADVRRQYDTTTCSVFAITDFLELSENDNKPLNISDENRRRRGIMFMELAPNLMSLAQTDAQENASTLHEMAERTSIIIPKQNPEVLAKALSEVKSTFCKSDLPVYFNTQKDLKVNVGSKVLRDQYAYQIIEHIISEKVK
jgi:hypothetical protein